MTDSGSLWSEGHGSIAEVASVFACLCSGRTVPGRFGIHHLSGGDLAEAHNQADGDYDSGEFVDSSVAHTQIEVSILALIHTGPA